MTSQLNPQDSVSLEHTQEQQVILMLPSEIAVPAWLTEPVGISGERANAVLELVIESVLTGRAQDEVDQIVGESYGWEVL